MQLAKKRLLEQAKPEVVESIRKERQKRRDKELEFVESKKLHVVSAKEEKKKLQEKINDEFLRESIEKKLRRARVLEQHQYTHQRMKQLQDKKLEETRKYRQSMLDAEEKQIKNKVLEHKNLEQYEEECLRRL